MKWLQSSESSVDNDVILPNIKELVAKRTKELEELESFQRETEYFSKVCDWTMERLVKKGLHRSDARVLVDG